MGRGGEGGNRFRKGDRREVIGVLRDRNGELVRRGMEVILLILTSPSS